MSRSRRRPVRSRVLLWSLPLAAAAVLVAALVAQNGPAESARIAADSSGVLDASYQTVTSWGTGYSGQYTITDGGTTAVSGWTLGFQLAPGTSVTSLWDGSYTDDGGQVTVTNDGWDATIAPGGSVSVGFVTSSSGTAGQPSGCTINGAACQAAGSAPSAPASSPATATPSPSSTPSVSSTPSAS